MPDGSHKSSLWSKDTRRDFCIHQHLHMLRAQTNKPTNRITSRVSIKKKGKHQHPRYKVSDRTALRSDWCKALDGLAHLPAGSSLSRQLLSVLGRFFLFLSWFSLPQYWVSFWTFVFHDDTDGLVVNPRHAGLQQVVVSGGVRYFCAKNGNFSRVCVRSGIPLSCKAR